MDQKQSLVKVDVVEKPLLAALSGHVLDRPPIWLMRQAGRYLPEYRAVREKAGSFLDLCYTPELAAEVTLQPIHRFGFDAAIVFADILLVPDALGQAVEYREGAGPVLQPIRDVPAIKALGRAEPLRRLAPVFETLRLLRRALPPDCALIGFAGAPWTVATYMVEGGPSSDHAHVRRWALADPRGFALLIDKLIDTTAEYLIAQIEAGAEALQIFDTWAGVLPASEFDRWCVEPVAAIISRVKRHHPRVPIIVFPRGAGANYDGFAAATGAQALSLDPSVSPEWAARLLQKQACLQGNLDPQILVVGGVAMETEVGRLLRILGHGPYVFNLGHGIVPQTPPDHVVELVRSVKAWRRPK